jgi:F0F1-type ATP synthase assembly protein I
LNKSADVDVGVGITDNIVVAICVGMIVSLAVGMSVGVIAVGVCKAPQATDPRSRIIRKRNVGRFIALNLSICY